MSFNRALGYLQRVSSPQIFRESRRRIEDTTESKKEEKKDEKQILCFRTKTAHIEQSLFDPIGPFSYVLSHMSGCLGQNGGNLREMALMTIVGTTVACSMSNIVGVTNVG